MSGMIEVKNNTRQIVAVCSNGQVVVAIPAHGSAEVNGEIWANFTKRVSVQNMLDRGSLEIVGAKKRPVPQPPPKPEPIVEEDLDDDDLDDDDLDGDEDDAKPFDE